MEGPFPKVLTFHLNYSDANALYPDNLLNLYATFPDSVKASDIFKIADPKE